MRIGIVSYWFNRGQGVVGRHMRSAFDELGHETFVLARLTKPTFVKPSFIADDDVWAQEGVTSGGAFDIDVDHYIGWAREHRLDAVVCFQNLQFDEIRALREAGVRTIGSFVWESFDPEHVEQALASYDIVYSLTLAEQARYRTFGFTSPYVQWGIHPELLDAADRRVHRRLPRPRWPRRRRVRFYYPGGYLTPRKPTEAVIEAFSRVSSPRAELLVRVQNEGRGASLRRQAERLDPRIRVVVGDLSNEEHHAHFRDSQVCLAPSRWEGLGLHLFESTAFGIPTITNDAPPMNEMVTDGLDGLLVDSAPSGEVSPGVPVLEPDVESISRCIEAMLDDERRAELAAGTAVRREDRRWERTVSDYRDLLARVGVRA